MSFAENPPKSYVPWRPNKSFVKFFEDMRHRRVSAVDGPVSRVTNTSPPSASGEANGARKGKKSTVKVNYSSPSEVISSTARSLTGQTTSGSSSSSSNNTSGKSKSKRKSRSGKKKATTTTKRRKLSKKKAPKRLEKKISKFKF